MVPKGWDALNLKNVAQKIQDGNYGADYPKADELVASGIPFLTSKVIGGNGTVNQDKFDYISEEKHQKLKKAQITSGDILFTNRGANVGTIAITPDYLSDGNIGPQLTLIRCNEKIEKDFLFQFLRGSFFQKQVRQQDSGSAMNFFGIKDTERFKILVPPLPEQKKIAQILSTWDKAITTTEQLLANSQQQKKALMQQLLTGKKRLLDKNGVRFSGEWKIRKIGDIGEIKSAGVDKKIVEGETAIRLLNFTDVFKKTYINSNDINHWVTAPASKVSGCNVLKGDVFFTPSSETRDEIGMSSVIYEDIDNCCYSYHIVRFRIKEEWDLNFKAFAFSTPSFRRQVSILADGSGQRYVVSQDNFRSVVISYPSLDEQRKIGSVLKASEDEIINLEKKLYALKQEKKALMQQLLTGKRRVTLN